jgi:hypothetical protein
MCVRRAVRAVIVALLALLVGAGNASAATDHVVITGGAVVPAGRTAGDVVVLDGTVRIAGRATGDVVSASGPVRVTGRIEGDLIAVSDRAFLGTTARVGGDLRYADERPVLARGARVGGEISNEGLGRRGERVGLGQPDRMVAGRLRLDADRRRPDGLAGGGTVRGGAGGARAPRRHGRLGCCDCDRRAAAGGAGLVTLVGIPFGIALLLAAIPVLVVAYTTSAWIVGRRVLRNRARLPWRRCSSAGESCACWR